MFSKHAVPTPASRAVLKDPPDLFIYLEWIFNGAQYVVVERRVCMNPGDEQEPLGMEPLFRLHWILPIHGINTGIPQFVNLFRSPRCFLLGKKL